MDISMDQMENMSVTDDNNSEEQQSQSEGAESSVRPSLTQVKKSWGFRRTTIARREFLDEVGNLTHSPPLVRRGRSRRTNQTPQATPETCATQRAPCATRSVIDDLEWSAPSSPVSEEGKPASEASAGGSLDPSLWQDFGSAFHTAFSLLGGNEGLSMDMSAALAVPDILEPTGAIKDPPPQAIYGTEVPDDIESADDIEISQPVAPDNVAGGEIDDVVLISSQEEDSDEMTLMQIKEQLASKGRQRDTRARGGKGGRGKARGRGRGRGKGRGKGRGRGRGRGRAVELQSSTADDEDNDDEVMLVNPAEQQLQQEKKENHPQSPAEIAISPITLSPDQQSSSDYIIIDTDLDQITDVTPGQYDDAPEEEEKNDKNVGEYSGISDSEGYDSNALYCICRQKHNKRFMICCDSCQEWFHGNCVGISETQGRNMETKGQEYICPPCTTKKQSQLQPEPRLQPELELSFPECLTLSPSVEEAEVHEEQQALKETVVVVEEEEAPVLRPEPEPKAEMETDSALSLCIGPGCSKQALPDSVYCGTICILQHAAITMKTLSGPKVPKSRGRTQRKAATARPTADGQGSGRMSKRLAGKAEEEGEEEEMKEDDGGQKEAASPLACDPSLTEVQATSIPSSKFYTASKEDSKQVEADSEDVTPSKQSPEDTSTDAAPSSQSATELAPPQSHSQEKAKEPVNSGVSKQQSAKSDTHIPPNPAKPSLSPTTQSPSTSAPRHHETGALMVTKTTYVIPKKQSGPQPPSSHVSASASCQKPSSAPTLMNETRNLLVPPAPSAPSSRPSQPNNQVRQSIQRSLTSILIKRVCDCEDLEMSESEVAKLVASIEMEMFDIFRNTDSKYMNKYRTIMFNLKDPRNKGLLYRVVHGEISPFRLVRMSQKDMQATKASEPSPKETAEVKDAAAKATSLLQRPEAVKVDLPSLNPARADRSMEHKKSLPAPALKTRTSQPSQGSAVPDILACMLKDTTSEHKAHLFDLKCKICTGQRLEGDEEEPAKKKPKGSETRYKYEPSWRKSAGDDSPLRAPPDSPDMDSPTSSLMDPSSHLTIDSPILTIVESPASPIMDSPASPTLESPASPVMESPASPTPDSPKATTRKRAYTPVVIPAVSTVTITRRDPRTAASRLPALSSGTSGPSNTTHNQSATYAPLKETRSASPSAPASSLLPTKTLPKSILMKPSSTADPRLYGTSSRTVISESPADGETSQFIAKQDILWKGFLNMLSVAKFVTKGYLVSGSAENLKADLPDTIQIGGRIMPQTVWDYVAKLKTSVTKELCVIRFHPATEEEEVAYVSLFSYFSSRGRFGVVANNSRSIKDVYLVPLSAKESIPSILQPLEGPGLEKNRPNLLLGLAIIQKAKRPGSLPQEIEEKRPKVQMSKDPMWIPKPPVLYGSDKLEIFQPYDPETPASTTPPGSPSCPGSPSESSSSGSVTIPSLLISIKANPPVSVSASVAATQSTSNKMNPITASSDKTPLQTILKTLFLNKQTDSSDGNSTTSAVRVKKLPVFSQVSGSMVDPIVQQYGQKSKVKEIEEEENDFDRPYDPEEEYDPAKGYGMVAPQSKEKIKADGPAVSGFVEDDVAYDPEDETIFADIQSDITVTKPPVPTQTSDSPSCPTPISTQAVTPAPIFTPAQNSTPAGVTENLPTGTVVVSAATLTEQQRMLEELNKQIEEQKRQLKEQEEALRQQREAVGMFMAHFSVSDSLMSPPPKSLPLSQLSSLQSGIIQTESRPSESTDKTSSLTETVDSSNVDSQTVKLEDTTATPNLKNDTDAVTEQDETQENVEESNNYSSAGEIEDSDVAYDPEDESLFNEIQEDVFQGVNIKTCDLSLSRTGRSASRKGTPPNSYHSRKRRSSPKRRSHRERDRHRSPSRRSPSHSQRRRDRHRRSERDRSRHRARAQSERQGHHRKEHSARRHSHGRRRSPSSPLTLSPKQHRGPPPQVLEKSKHVSVPCNAPDSSDTVVGQFIESNTSSCTSVTVKNYPDGHQLKCNLVESPDKDFSPYSHELLHNVKLEISEPPKSQELQKNSVSDHDDTGSGSSTQVDKPSQQEILLKNKIESTVPLREIDPPIRDSPQSPDPEPQFVKPSCIAKSDSVKIEEISDPETYTSVSVPLVKVENNYLPIGGQATMSNILWSTVGGPISDVRNWESPDLRHPETLGHGGGHSNLATGSDIQGSGPEIDPMTKHPGVSGPVIKNTGPDMTEPVNSSSMQGVNPEVKGPGPDVRQCEPETRGKMLVPAVTNSHMGGSGLQNEKRDPLMKGPLSDRPGPDRGSGSMELFLPMYHPSPDTKGPILVDERKSKDVRCLQKGLLCLKTEEQTQSENPGVMEIGRDQYFEGPQVEGRAPNIIGRGRGRKDTGESPHTWGMRSAMSGGDVREPIRDIRSPGPSFRGSERVQRQSRHDGSPVLEERGPWKRGFQPYGRHADLSRVGGSRERSLDSNTSTGSDGIDLRADRLTPAMTDERRGPRRGRDVPMRGPGPNINYESGGSNMSCIGQDSCGPREHFKEPRPDIRVERSVHVPDMRESETLHELRRPDTTERSYMGPCQDMGTVGGSDTRADRSESHARSSGRDIGETGPNRRDADMQVRNIEGLWLERRNEQMAQEDTGPMPNITNPDWRGPGPGLVGPDMRGQRSQNKGLGPHMGDPDWSGPGSDIRDDWRGPDRRGSGPVRGESFMQDDWRVHQPDRRGPNMESQGPDKRRPRGPDFMAPGPLKIGPDMEVPMRDRRGPGGPDFIGPGLERRGPEMEVPMHDRRGPGGPDFIGPGLERRGPDMEVPMHDRRGPGVPDFFGPGLERRGPDVEVPMHDRRGPGGPDFMGPGPDMVVPMHDRRGPGGPDFRRPEPERKGPTNDNLGPGMRGPGGPDFVGPGLERRGLAMEGPGPNRRGPAGPDFRESWPERRGPDMVGPGPDRRGPGDQDVWGPGPERRGPAIEGPGTDRQGPGGLNFRGPGPERRGPAMEGPGTDRRGPGGPDFRGLGPESKGLSMEAPGPDIRGPGGPDFRGPGPKRRSLSIEHHGLDRRGSLCPDFRGPGPGRRSPAMEAPGPDRRGPGGPDFSVPGPENKGLSMEAPGPDRGRPGGPDFREPGPERRSLSMERHGLDNRGPGCPDFRGPGPERRGPAMGGPGPDRRELGVPDFSGPGHERRGRSMDSQEPDMRGPGGPNFQGPGPERRGLVVDGPGPDRRGPGGPDLRGPGCERRVPSMQGQGPDRRGSGDQNSGGLGPDRRGPYIRGPGPYVIGLGPERTGPESGHPNMEGPEPDRRGPDIRGPRLERSGSGMEGPGPNRRGPGGPNMRRPGLQHSGPIIEGPGPDRSGPEGPNFRGPGPDRRPPDMKGTGNSRGFPGGPQFRGLEPERRPPDMEDMESDRRGPHFRGVRPGRTVMEGPGPNRKVPRGPNFRGPSCEDRYPHIEGLGPDRQEPGGSGFSEPGPERRGPDMEGPGPDWRRSGGPDFRGPGIRQKGPNTEGLRNRRDDWGGADFGGSEPIQESPDIEGPGPDRTGRNLRGPGPMKRNTRGPGPDMSSLNRGDRWKGLDFRGSAPDRRGTDTEECWSDGRGPNMEAVGNESECSGDDWKRHGNKGPGPIQEGSDEQVQEHSRQGPCMEWRGPGRRGPRPIQERPNRQFTGPLRGPGDDFSGPGCNGPGPFKDDPDIVCPGPGRGGPGNEWREPDRGGAGPNRWGPGPFFRGKRDPDNRGQGHDSRGPGMRGLGSDVRGDPDMGNDWKQPDFSGNMRGPNTEGPGDHRGGPDFMNSCPNRRGLGGPDLRRPGPEHRNSNIEGPGTDGRFSDCGGLGSERRGVDMDSPGTGRQGFEHDFRRERRGPDMRRQGPDKTDVRGPAPESSDIRHGPGRWDTNTEGPGLDSRGSEPASPNFNSPYQVTRFQGPSDPHSAPYSGPLGPGQNSGGNACPGFDNLQNQQAVKPQRHRAALLPTPTEGLIRFPNRRINNPDVFSPKRKQIGHPTDRDWSRGRSVSRERELVKGQRQEQEKSLADKTSTPVDAGTGGGEEKKEEGNETDKQGIHGACVETKNNQSMDHDRNKSNVEPS
ncbi:uncharacterized protein LOC122883584 [Siniperca chuatsi]|uniref:uncharacterized protein LOC122883584 n=1 Tax=Siniperca chuatsi TaxID=119488 RepID=UPI001CE1433B|nr:uncharacterized protein LOC122883584 [Siniperca chuatsi]XP_044068421.1 uncharacterized protein LOC122883584 [Siniperca chuatsi]